MKRHSGKFVWQVSLVLTLAVLVMVAGALPASAARQYKRAPGEKAVGGLTVEEQVARQLKLHDEIMSRMPVDVDKAPLRIEITQKDRDDIAAPFASGTAPLRIGVVKTVAGMVGKPGGQAFNRGVLEEGVGGSFMWALQVTSPGAQAIRVRMSDFSLPSNTEMFLLSDNGQAHGPYTGVGRNGNGDFWTRSINSDSGKIVLRYNGNQPDIDRPQMSFVISEVAHISGRPPRPREQSHDSWPCSDNAPCVVDVNCVNTGPAGPAEDAVAKMEWLQGPFVYTCTGGLLVDTDAGSQIPYFLTANHCLTSNNSSLETFFNYTTSSCNGDCPDSLVTGGTPPAASTIGVTVVATGSGGDFTLLTLDQAPPAGAVFLGWNNTPIANSNGSALYRISNANFGPQVYSQHTVDTSKPTCQGWPRGERIYSHDNTGATMGGSSGSPVVNSSGDVVGQLSGCCGYNCGDECDAGSNATVDGALAYYWDSVAPFLDPGTPSACDNDGTCEAGEDCNNCPNDCGSKVSGNPNSRYCCDGDLPNCGDTRCNESPFSCGGGGGCTFNSECVDPDFCNGEETCVGGTCQPGTAPCASAGETCDEVNDVCVSCGVNKASCTQNSDCCSNNCRNGTCKGN